MKRAALALLFAAQAVSAAPAKDPEGPYKKLIPLRVDNTYLLIKK